MATPNTRPVPVKLSKEPQDWLQIIHEWLDMDTLKGGACMEWEFLQTSDEYVDFSHYEEYDVDVSAHDGAYVEVRLSIDVENLIVFCVIESRCNKHDTGGCHGRTEELRIDCERGTYYDMHLLTEHLNNGLCNAGVGGRFTMGKLEWEGFTDG